MIPSETEVICYAIQHVPKNAFIIITTAIIADAITAVKQCQQEEILKQNSHSVDNFNNDTISINGEVAPMECVKSS